MVFREFAIGGSKTIRAAIVYVDGLVNSRLISDGALKPLIVDSQWVDAAEKVDACSAYQIIRDRLLAIGKVPKQISLTSWWITS